MINLPKQKIEPTNLSPRKLMIYSKPKVGKTAALAALEGAFIIDLEKGTEFVSALKYDIITESEKNNRTPLQELKELCKEIKAQGKPYKYGVVDTITKLEDLVLPLAVSLYKSTPQGKNWDGTNILHLPNGGGYAFLRSALFLVLDEIYSAFDNVILLGHLKNTVIEKNGKEVNAFDIDLTGKIKSIVSADMDAVGLLYRAESGKNILSFKTTDDIICGARPAHLKNKEILLSEEENGNLKVYWNEIFK